VKMVRFLTRVKWWLKTAYHRVWMYLFGCGCYFCGRRISRSYDYSSSPGGGWIVCKQCCIERLPLSLRNAWYRDPTLGALRGSTHYCPECDKSTMWWYEFPDEERKEPPVAARCSGCGKVVSFGV